MRNKKESRKSYRINTGITCRICLYICFFSHSNRNNPPGIDFPGRRWSRGRSIDSRKFEQGLRPSENVPVPSSAAYTSEANPRLYL